MCKALYLAIAAKWRCLLISAQICLLSVAAAGAAQIADLELRPFGGDATANFVVPVPAEAVKVFAYEGIPLNVRVTDQFIAADYARTGVLFDRANGEVVRRFTSADGWPQRRPEGFGPLPQSNPVGRFVGPGIANPKFPWPTEGGLVIVAQAEWQGGSWRALQPRDFLNQLFERDDSREGRARGLSWSQILEELNDHSFVETDGRQRYTTTNGLAGNIVTHLVAFDDSLWAACVDIYDPVKQEWFLGGLCRLAKSGQQWERVKTIDGHPVRWVTLLQSIGDELWVGFREGQWVAGERIYFGMGYYPGVYRPQASTLVVARLQRGRWATYSRPLQAEPEHEARWPNQNGPAPPTEMPLKLGRAADFAILFSVADAHQQTGELCPPLAGQVSWINLTKREWHVPDIGRDFDSDQLEDCFFEGGEILVASNRGLHRFDPKTASWRFLDTRSLLRNSAFNAAVLSDGELWVGYDRQSFGVYGQQGLSRYSEKSSQWRFMSPADLGTASPIRGIAQLHNGEAWVAFAEQPYGGSMGRWTYFPHERIPRPAGLGRYRNGQWQFPMESPQTANDTNRYLRAALGVDEAVLVALGDALIYQTGGALFAGPAPWRQITRGNLMIITPMENSQALEIIRARQLSTEFTVPGERAVFRPGAGELQFSQLNGGYWNAVADRIEQRGGFQINRQDSKRWILWTPHPPRSRSPVVGARCLESAAAIWLLNEGQIVRLDRKLLMTALTELERR